MRNILTAIFLLLIIGSVHAQDIHFSQMDLNSAMRNPATMGQMPHTNKLTASYRSQWTALPAAYRNINLAYEHRISRLTLGGSILHNDAGRNSLRNSQLMLNLGYQKRLSERDEFIAIGVSGGVIQKRFQPELLDFDNQYVEGQGLNRGLDNGETFLRTSQILPTATAGVFMSKYLNRIKGSVGLSFAHLNKPTSEFYEGHLEYYPVRTSLFASVQFFMRQKVKWEIRYAYNQQLVANEKMAGIRLQYQLAPHNWLVGGVGMRIGDAFIFEGGMKFKNGSVIVSYDMNNSQLAAVTRSNGALELSVTYGLSKKDPIKQQRVAHPFPAKQEKDIVKKEEEKPEKGSDSDGDGILDNKDECPNIPGLVQFNGCNDSDRDGVWNSIDACPNLYGDKTNRGCPISRKDSDKDGMIDEVDNCPFLKGTPEMKGCPDTDKDGISDMYDKCPFLKGEKDNNGCPKMNMDEHKAMVRTRSVRALVQFSTNQARIDPQYYKRLEKVIIFLLDNPKAEAFITGHTDDEGNSEFNYRLGEKRAMAVKEFLMETGVDPAQLSTISYGEFKPKNTNKSAYEKAKNRRVEVTVYLR